VLVALRPQADDAGDAVIFDASAAEFRGDDGAESFLTGPSRLLADTVLVPRLQGLRVDVAGALAEIDALIEQFLGARRDGTPALAEGGRLQRVAAAEPGLRVDLAFALNEARAASSAAAAVPEPALSADERAAMQSVEDALDGFITLVVRDLAPRLESRDRQLELLALLIDLRTELATLLSDGTTDSGDRDPLRALFLDSWSRLAAILAELPAVTGQGDYALRMASFLAAGDALRLVDDLGPAFGIELTRAGLLRLARMLLAGETPPSLTPLPTAEDRTLQALFGFTAASAIPPAARPPVAWYEQLLPVRRAFARDPAPALLLREIFPRRDNLDVYLGVVASLIDETLESHWEDSRLTVEQRELFEPLVRATAWKETCWRHYLPAEDGFTVIRSGVGAVGMMQIVGRVWRSLFDLERLEADVAYNLAAGIDILEHYFVDYAVRRGEDQHEGGADNLVRATYAAYNGGPSKLSRYRREDAPARARAVDEQFYRQYIVMRDETWPRQSRCYVR
jgi:hypothetical protein